MNEIIALTISGIFLAGYIVLSAIEFGSSTFALFPKLLDRKVSLETYINPLWESNNVFLIVFIISLLSFFPASISVLGTNLLVIVFSTLLISCFRILAVLFIFYGNSKHILARVVLWLSSMLVPVLFSQTAVFALAGTTYVNPLTFGIGLFALTSIFALAFSFFNVLQPRETESKLNRWTGIAVVIYYFSIIYLFYTAHRGASYLYFDLRNVGIAKLIVCFFILISALMWIFRKKAFFFYGVILTTLATVFALFFLQFPFLVYPSVTVYSSFTDPALFPWYLAAFVAGMILVIPSLIFLYVLFVFKKGDGGFHY